jgi:uncharacterized protein YqjF (DUF2071 family)
MGLLDEIAHRPWPLPSAPWVMAQVWHDLLFMHWPVPVDRLRERVPAPLELDTFEGRAWLGIVPFRMTGVRLRWTPALPGLSAFPELNVRTYVRSGDRPGVWFFSLDAADAFAVAAARAWFLLPYYWARMSCTPDGEAIRYTHERRHPGAPPARLEGRYAPAGPVFRAARGTLAHWLTERYCLYAGRSGRILRADIHHAPWPLQPATASFERNTMAEAHGLDTPRRTSDVARSQTAGRQHVEGPDQRDARGRRGPDRRTLRSRGLDGDLDGSVRGQPHLGDRRFEQRVRAPTSGLDAVRGVAIAEVPGVDDDGRPRALART